MIRRLPRSTLFLYTTLFRSSFTAMSHTTCHMSISLDGFVAGPDRSEEHTSELQSRFDLVCRLLLEKTKTSKTTPKMPYTPGRRDSPPLQPPYRVSTASRHMP